LRLSKTISPEFLSARDAVDRIPDRARLLVEASGGGVLEPSALITALAERYTHTGAPSALSVYFCSGVGDRNGAGMDVKRERERNVTQIYDSPSPHDCHVRDDEVGSVY